MIRSFPRVVLKKPIVWTRSMAITLWTKRKKHKMVLVKMIAEKAFNEKIDESNEVFEYRIFHPEAWKKLEELLYMSPNFVTRDS